MIAKMYNYNTWIKYETEEKFIKEMEQFIIKSGFTIVGYKEHFFEKQGYTGVWLLAESHLAVHTFPEENKTYIELTSCVKSYFDNLIELININYKKIEENK